MEEMSIIDQLAMLRITASSEIPPHEFLFEWNGTPCFARGELVAVTGKAKSGKTYLNSLLMAEAGRDSGLTSEAPNKERLGLVRMQEKPMRVVWIDTEQSEDTTCEILRDRISAMTSRIPDENLYHVFNLRKIQWKDRMTLVLSAIAICQPDVVIFDGIRDVVGDINDYTEAQNTIGQLLRVASEFHTCIVCVLHQNKAIEDKTLRGALGTELQNKSFETYECSKDPETRIFTIKQTATRKYDMPNKIQFCLDKAGLPVLCQNVEEEVQLDVRDVFRQSMMGHSEMRAGALKAQVRMRYRITRDEDYGALLSAALHEGILTKRVVSDREVYYLPGENMYEPQLDFGRL